MSKHKMRAYFFGASKKTHVSPENQPIIHNRDDNSAVNLLDNASNDGLSSMNRQILRDTLTGIPRLPYCRYGIFEEDPRFLDLFGEGVEEDADLLVPTFVAYDRVIQPETLDKIIRLTNEMSIRADQIEQWNKFGYELPGTVQTNIHLFFIFAFSLLVILPFVSTPFFFPLLTLFPHSVLVGALIVVGVESIVLGVPVVVTAVCSLLATVRDVVMYEGSQKLKSDAEEIKALLAEPLEEDPDQLANPVFQVRPTR